MLQQQKFKRFGEDLLQENLYLINNLNNTIISNQKYIMKILLEANFVLKKIVNLFNKVENNKLLINLLIKLILIFVKI